MQDLQVRSCVEAVILRAEWQPDGRRDGQHRMCANPGPRTDNRPIASRLVQERRKDRPRCLSRARGFEGPKSKVKCSRQVRNANSDVERSGNMYFLSTRASRIRLREA